MKKLSMCSRNSTQNSAENASEMFTTIPLKRVSKKIVSNVTDKLYFPKIQQEIAIDPKNHDCFNTFWMAGFLHHEKNENEKLVSATMYLLLEHSVKHDFLLQIY